MGISWTERADLSGKVTVPPQSGSAGGFSSPSPEFQPGGEKRSGTVIFLSVSVFLLVYYFFFVV